MANISLLESIEVLRLTIVVDLLGVSLMNVGGDLECGLSPFSSKPTDGPFFQFVVLVLYIMRFIPSVIWLSLRGLYSSYCIPMSIKPGFFSP